MTKHDCQFLDVKFIKKIPHPKFPTDRTASVTLLGCSVCGQLYELIEGPEEDRWGTGGSEKRKIDLTEAMKEFDISEGEIKAKM